MQLLFTLLAMAALGLWLASAVAIGRGARVVALVLNTATTALAWLVFAPRPIQYLLDSAGYVRQLGAAAIAEIPISLALIGASSLGALCCAVASRRIWLAFIGWALNGPVVAVLTYMAFLFRPHW
jgi:hypothetical protein